MNRIAVVSVAALAALAGAAAWPQAADLAAQELERHVWDLAPLYPDAGAWEAERAAILVGIGEVAGLRGRMHRSSTALADGLDAIYALRARAARMAVYGLLRHEVDVVSEEARARYDVGTALEAQVESAVAFLNDEVRAVGAARLGDWVAREPRLERHRRRLNRIARELPHTLPAESQALLAGAARWPRLSADVYGVLGTAELGWPRLERADGSTVTLDPGGYMTLRASADAGDRAAAERAFFAKLADLEELYGLLYTRRIDADLTLARPRGFASGIDALWFLRDGMPPGSVETMTTAARAQRDLLQRYARVRARAAGARRSLYTDLWAPPPALERRFTVREAMALAVEALSPLGAAYQARLRARFAEPWFHLPPRPEKASTFGVFPGIAGSPPFTVMTFRGDLRSSRGLTGAAALMMAFADIPAERAPDTRDDPPIYANATIYVGDLLHDDLLRERASGPAERLAVTIATLDLVRRNFYDYAIASELDRRVEERIARGAAPSGAEVSRLQLELLREAYEEPVGGVAVATELGRSWILVPVAFLSYEHQFWPPAMAAACALVERLRTGDPGARRLMHEALGRGEVDWSYDLFRDAGIDFASGEPYAALARRMRELLDEAERLLDEIGG